MSGPNLAKRFNRLGDHVRDLPQPGNMLLREDAGHEPTRTWKVCRAWGRQVRSKRCHSHPSSLSHAGRSDSEGEVESKCPYEVMAVQPWMPLLPDGTPFDVSVEVRASAFKAAQCNGTSRENAKYVVHSLQRDQAT